MKCVICEKEIIGPGHNAEPIAKGQCCDGCNKKVLHKRYLDALKSGSVNIVDWLFNQDLENESEE